MPATTAPATALSSPSIETLDALLNITYTWGYQETRQKLRDLYDKAVRAQWISDDVLPWQADVDLDKPMGPEILMPLFGSDIWNKMTEAERHAMNIETFSWTLSQFLHGEQGALLATAQLVDSVTDLDSKLYAASQVVDEARHVDVYNPYVHTKIGFSYPVNPHLKTLLDMILKDSRWDMKFLGMQIMVEGLALGAFGTLYRQTHEPLLKQLLKMVIQDEARHVHYGVLALREHMTKELSEAERNEREDWAFEVALLMRNRFLAYEIYDEQFVGVLTREQWRRFVLESPGLHEFRTVMFSRLVPNLREIGLMSPRIVPHYERAGLMRYFGGVAADKLSGEQMIRDLDRAA
jgi:hypothetical protein